MSKISHIFIVIVALLSVSVAEGQTIALGERIKRTKNIKWLNDNKPHKSTFTYMEFILSNTTPCRDTATHTHRIVQEYSSMSFVLVTQENASEIGEWVKALLGPKSGVIIEDQRIRASFGISYVPYAVILNRKNKVLWFGNPQQLSKRSIDQLLMKQQRRTK